MVSKSFAIFNFFLLYTPNAIKNKLPRRKRLEIKPQGIQECSIKKGPHAIAQGPEIAPYFLNELFNRRLKKAKV